MVEGVMIQSCIAIFTKNITNLGSNSDALGGSPAPSTIQENSGDSLLWIVFELEVMISFSRACRIFNQDYK